MATKYNLNIAEFDTAVSEFIETKQKYIVEKTSQTGNRITYHFKEKEKSKVISILDCFNSVGRTSFQFGGSDKDIARQCSIHLIDKTTIKIQEKKNFTVKPVTDEEFDLLIGELTDQKYLIEDSIPTSSTIKKIQKLNGRHKEVLTLTFYNNGTLMAQGRPSMLFIHFISIACDLLNPTDIRSEFLKYLSVTNEDNIDFGELSKYLPSGYNKLSEKLISIMSVSLILLKNPLDLPDYTAYAFPVLKGSEGVLKDIFYKSGITITDFGDYFKVNRLKNQAEWVQDCSSIFSDNLKDCLLNLYFYYYKERHTLFHTDATIETSRTLDYSQSVDIILEGLKLIDCVLRYSSI